MTRARLATSKPRHDPLVLVVGAAPKLAATCRAAAFRVPARVAECDLSAAATMAAKWLPFAIVVTQELYDFDAGEFSALARDVRAALVKVPNADISAHEMTALLQLAANEARARRHE